jgi:cyclic pyranopterin monophosphate synthase
MSKKQFTHVSAEGKPQMVDVSGKEVTVRKAEAQAIVVPGSEILQHLSNGEITTKKGPVFQTAIIAGVMAAKKTSELIPFCHPVGLEDCQIDIRVEEDRIFVHSSATVSGKTGVEMEALTAATVAALTIYDMCKALSHDIVIEEVKLMAKSGGKKDFKRNNA